MISPRFLVWPLLYGLYFLFRKKISGLSRTNQERQESLMERLQEDLSVVKALQAFSVVRARTSDTIPYMLRSEESRRKLDMQYAVASSSTIVINLIGLGLGPPAIGALNDALTSTHGPHAIRLSLSVIALSNLWAAVHFFLAAKTTREDVAG